MEPFPAVKTWLYRQPGLILDVSICIAPCGHYIVLGMRHVDRVMGPVQVHQVTIFDAYEDIHDLDYADTTAMQMAASTGIPLDNFEVIQP